ncbi:MAG: sterol desaturase family protein [Pseudomonadota bacterium]
MEVYYIVYAVPVFFLLIGIELAWGVRQGRNTYRLADTLASIGAGVWSVLTGIFTRGVLVVIYAFVFDRLAPTALPADRLWVWLLAIVGYDLCYYGFHRLSHERAVLWAAHVVHHQSEDFNLGTALRQSSTTFLFGWVFYLPLALIGVPPAVFAAAAGINLLYQYWVHTEHVPKLGWFDRVFVTASNHRVHHGRNDAYLDRNYGGIFILWDRLFGTFAEEDNADPVRFGIRKPFNRFNAVAANIAPYADLIADARATRHGVDRLRIPFARTGWRPRDLAPEAPPLLHAPKFDTARPAWVDHYALGQFVILNGVTILLLAASSTMPLLAVVVLAALVTHGLWILGELMERGAAAGRQEGWRQLIAVGAVGVLALAGQIPVAALAIAAVLAGASWLWLRRGLATDLPAVA